MLIPQSHWHVPEETQEIAGAAFPKGNPYVFVKPKSRQLIIENRGSWLKDENE